MNIDGEIDYQKFTDAELFEARQLINTRAFPINSRNLRNEIASRNIRSRPSLQKRTDFIERQDAPPKVVSFESFLLPALFCFLILIIGGYELFTKGQFSLPGRVGNDTVVGAAAKFFYAFFFIAFVANCIVIYSLLKYNNIDNRVFRFGKYILNFALIIFILYCVILMFRGRA